jgi:hypothetical protein
MKTTFLMTILVSLLALSTQAQTFTEQTGLGFTGLNYPTASWADYNNDGFLDLLVSGSTTTSFTGAVTKLYKNNGNNSFTEQTSLNLPPTMEGALAWADYNNDGYMDFVISSNYYPGTGLTKIYKNNGPSSGYSFSEVTLPGYENQYTNLIDWADYNNDGLMDLLIIGKDNSNKYGSRIFKNLGNDLFEYQPNISFSNVIFKSFKWGDMNNDGYIDLVASNYPLGTVIYLNDGHENFVKQSDSLSGGLISTLDLADYDNDGDLDIFIAGRTLLNYGSSYTKLYINNNGSFTEATNTGIPNISKGYVQSADFNHDGYIDLLITGYSSNTTKQTAIIKNNGNNTFTPILGTTLLDISDSKSIWVDYNNDGNLDIFLIGSSASGPIAKLYKGDSLVQNSPPSPPTNLSYILTNSGYIFKWNRSTDDNTPNSSITYNIRIGSAPNIENLDGSESDNLGFRRLVKRGDIQDTFCIIAPFASLPACSTFYVSVQAIDQEYKGSAFSTTISIQNQWTIDAGINRNVYLGDSVYFSATNNACGASSYQWAPSSYLNSSTIQNPIAFPLKTTTFYLTVTSNSQQKTDSFTVFVDDLKSDTSIILPVHNNGSTEWADVDNDGDLDIVLAGQVDNNTRVFKIYKNDNGSFSEAFNYSFASNEIPINLVIADFNNDGLIDIIMVETLGSLYQSKLLINHGSFIFIEKVNSGLPGIQYGDITVGDFNNDGYEDLLLCGISSFTSQPILSIYENNKDTSFSIFSSFLVDGIYNGSVKWFDYNNDGYLDIFAFGSTGFSKITKVYENYKGYKFIDLGFNFELLLGIGSTLDYNSDGFMDFYIIGYDQNYIQKSFVYQNDGIGGFNLDINKFSIDANTISIAISADYNNDGKMDILVDGLSGGMNKSEIFSYDDNLGFHVISSPSFSTFSSSDARWGDMDNDGDLDLFRGGLMNSVNTNLVMKNLSLTPNVAPTVPNITKFDSTECKLLWSRSTDDFTNSKSLSYNLAIGSSSNSFEIIAPLADVNSGYLKTPQMGNQQLDTFTVLNLPYDSTYFAKVQAIDDGFKGSAFSSVFQFVMPPFAVLSQDTAIPCGGSKQLYAIVTNGDTAGLTYEWTPSQSLSNPYIYNPVASPSSSTWYKVKITSSMGHSYSDSVHIAVGLFIDMSDIYISCGDSGSFGASVISNANSTTYLWSPGYGLSDSTILNPIVKLTETTVYTLYASDSLCNNSKSVVAYFQNADYKTNFSVDQNIFNSVPATVTFTNTTPNSNNYDFEWIFGDGDTLLSNNLVVSHTYADSGLYSVQLIAISKSTGCEDTLTRTNFINCMSVGINQNYESEAKLSIAPNPNNGEFVIYLTGQNGRVRNMILYSIVGEVLYSEPIDNQDFINGKKMNLNNISKGIYFLVINTDGRRIVRKLIIE